MRVCVVVAHTNLCKQQVKQDLGLELSLHLRQLGFQALDAQVLILQTLRFSLELSQIVTDPGIAAFQLRNLTLVILH